MRGVFLARPNRFVAQVRLNDGREVSVHVASSGRMTELLIPGALVEVDLHDTQENRKTVGLLTMVAAGDSWVSVDTSLPGKLLRRAFAQQRIEEFAQYTEVRPEYTYGDSRIDFLLTGPGLPPCLAEVKSVTTAIPDPDGARVARFPDAPTERGAKHLRELMKARESGYRTAVCFIIQRNDVDAVGPYDEIDSAFGATFREAVAAGVEVHAWVLNVSPEKTVLGRSVPLRI